jgi:lipopolysaccharide/colanic/teichoic acid biosynthesis glycosyltransferase
MLLVGPLFLVLAAAVKLGDGGPVFFRQERVGTHGRTFGMLKFRSMIMWKTAGAVLPSRGAY